MLNVKLCASLSLYKKMQMYCYQIYIVQIIKTKIIYNALVHNNISYIITYIVYREYDTNSINTKSMIGNNKVNPLKNIESKEVEKKSYTVIR